MPDPIYGDLETAARDASDMGAHAVSAELRALAARANKPMTLSELAARLGHDRPWLTRRRTPGAPRKIDLMIEHDGFPPPLASVGQMRFDRRSVEAWLNRHHPLAPRMPAAANDTAPHSLGDDCASVQRRLRQAYGGA